MKVKSALMQSKMHAKFLGAVLVVLLGSLAFFRNTAIGIFAGLAALGLAMEVINIVYIRRRSRRDPGYMEEKIQ